MDLEESIAYSAEFNAVKHIAPICVSESVQKYPRTMSVWICSSLVVTEGYVFMRRTVTPEIGGS